MSLSAIIYSQRNPVVTGSVNTTTQSTTISSDSKNNRYTSNNNNSSISTNTNTNSNDNTSNNSSNNGWINTNSNNSNNNYSNNNNNSYYNNGYYNNNSYNNNNGYSNNNTYSSTYQNQSSYKVTDDNYGTDLVSEDKTVLKNKTCEYNTTDMMSNYRSTTAIDRFFKNNQKTSQIFVINAQKQNTLKGNDGTVIKIAPNSFVTKDGEIVKGDVEFELKEVYDRSSMVTSNAHTVCNDVPLVSGGEMYMGATQGDQPLMLASNTPIAVEMPANSKEPMQLFYGKPDRNTVNWNLANNNSVSPVLNSNSSTGYSYNFSSNSMNWLNCDRFIRSDKPSTKVNVRVSVQYDTTNTAIFMVFTGQNTVTKFDHFTKLDRLAEDLNPSVFDTRWYSVPVGSDVTIVALSEINGQYYSSMQRTMLVKDHTTELLLEPTTLDQFKQDMEKLP